ncbi:hypothetical protein CPB85DRAFT_1310057, partial [Mucidula mucida]
MAYESTNHICIHFGASADRCQYPRRIQTLWIRLGRLVGTRPQRYVLVRGTRYDGYHFVQVFYAWRIWILTGRFWIPGAILLFSLTQCVAGMYAGDCANRVQYFSVLQSDHTTHVVKSLWLAGTALCDTVIAVAMSWTLLRARTGVRSTDVIVVKIVRLSIETGTICAICALLDLSFYLGFKNNNYYTLPSIALNKLYSNSFFAVLNSRAKISATQKGGIVGAETGLRCTCGVSAAFESLETRWRRSNFTVAALTALDVERTQASQISPPASSDG